MYAAKVNGAPGPVFISGVVSSRPWRNGSRMVSGGSVHMILDPDQLSRWSMAGVE
jgi:hypothetical protein